MKFKMILFIALLLTLVACKGPRPNDSTEPLSLTPVGDPISSSVNAGASISGTTDDASDSDEDEDNESIDTTDTDVITVEVDTSTTSDTTTNTTSNTDTQTTQNNTVAQQPASQPVQTNNSSGCTVRTDLPVYTVVAGDTLFKIATRAEMTVDEIVRVNCLDNRNVIEVGQQLRLTTAIGGENNDTIIVQDTGSSNTTVQDTSQTTESIAPEREGTLVISPWQTNNGNIYIVRTDVELTVQWMGVPKNRGITQVEFIYVDNRSINSPQSIGIDSDLSNGAMVSWNPPEIIQGTVYAVSRLPGQRHQLIQSNTSTVTTYVEPTPNEVGTISISPYLTQNGDNFTVNTTMELTLRWVGGSERPWTDAGGVHL